MPDPKMKSFYIETMTTVGGPVVHGPFSNAHEAEKAAWEVISGDPEFPGIGDFRLLIAMAFISQHDPTPQQTELALERGYVLIHVGDENAFDRDALIKKMAGFSAVAIVNAGAALNFASAACEHAPLTIGVFENAKRGQGPFVAEKLHLWAAYKDSSFGVFPR